MDSRIRLFYQKALIGLLIFSFWPKPIHAADLFCRVLYVDTRPPEAIDYSHVLTDDELLRIYDAVTYISTGRTLLHYTTREGLIKILQNNRIVATKKNRSYFTRSGFSPLDVERDLFINSPGSEGHGNYVIVLRQAEGALLTSSPGKPFEYYQVGTYRFQPEDIIYAGPNPF